MGALAVEQSVPTLLVLEQYEILAQQADGLHRSLPGELFGKRRRLPIEAQQLPAGSARPDPRHPLVRLGCEHDASGPDAGATPRL